MEKAGRKEEGRRGGTGEKRDPRFRRQQPLNYSFTPKGPLKNSFLKSHNNA